MTDLDYSIEESSDLRRQAKEIVMQDCAFKPEDLTAMSREDISQKLYELRVHQIELEMQNEELGAVQAELEDSRARYFDLYDLAPVGYCTLSKQGLILEANFTAATLLDLTRGELVKNNTELAQTMADQKSVTLKNIVPQGIKVFADPNMLNTVLRNLISNAIKFSTPTGSVTIEATQGNGMTTVSV